VAEKVCPVVALVRPSETSHYINLNQEAIFASAVKPCGKELLINTILLIVKTSKSIIALENKMTKSTLQKDNKKIIDEAKTILITKMNLSEDEAHRRIQKQSMDKGLTKVKVAELIIRTFK
jgi:response regulator NasT